MVRRRRSKYPEQQNDSDNNPGDNSQIVSSNAEDPEVLQSHNDDPDEPDDTGYPDTMDISTGTAQDPDPTTYSDMGQEGRFTPHEETSIPEKGNSGSEKEGKRPPRVEVNQGGLKMMTWGLFHVRPFWTNFLKNRVAEDPQGLNSKIWPE